MIYIIVYLRSKFQQSNPAELYDNCRTRTKPELRWNSALPHQIGFWHWPAYDLEVVVRNMIPEDICWSDKGIAAALALKMDVIATRSISIGTSGSDRASKLKQARGIMWACPARCPRHQPRCTYTARLATSSISTSITAVMSLVIFNQCIYSLTFNTFFPTCRA